MRDELSKDDQKAIDDWLKNNKVVVCKPGERADPDNNSYGWNKKKKKTSDAE
jgi:hypothetical protein